MHGTTCRLLPRRPTMRLPAATKGATLDARQRRRLPAAAAARDDTALSPWRGIAGWSSLV